MWSVLYKVQFALFLLASARCSSFNEPWEEAVSLARRLPTQINPVEQNSAVYGDLYSSAEDEQLLSNISMDYYETEQEEMFMRFWSHEATEEQKRYYDILKEATETGSYRANAHWELKELFLNGKHLFPHNKTLAWYHLEEFNKLTKGQNHTALFELSVMHSTGLFGTIPTNIGKALILLERAAKLGDIRAKQALAYRYMKGINVPKDTVKASIIYGEIADNIRDKYTFDQWNFLFPDVDSYHVSLSHIQDATNMKYNRILRGGPSRAPRAKRTISPELESLISTNGRVIIQSENLLISEDEDVKDKIVDIYYAALNAHQGTYSKHRDYEQSARLLELAVELFGPEVGNMDELQKLHYAKCLQLLGHMHLRGEGLPTNITKAELLFEEALSTTDKKHVVESSIQLGSIKQYVHGETADAIAIYEHFHNLSPQGYAAFQLSRLIPSYVSTDERSTMKKSYVAEASAKGYIPALYEKGRMLEAGHSSINGIPMVSIASSYEKFIQSNEQFVGENLKEAFLNLLRGEPEVALWNYALAAEQGFGLAQLSAAWLLYQPAHNFEEPPHVPDSRKLMALSYYKRAFDQKNPEAGLIAGDIYFSFGEYEKAFDLYLRGLSFPCPQALWNIGYMFEHGLGVEKDYHLAKRYFENSQVYNRELSLGVQLCIWKLKLKMFLDSFVRTIDRASKQHGIRVKQVLLLGEQSFSREGFISRLFHRIKQLLDYAFGSGGNRRYHEPTGDGR